MSQFITPKAFAFQLIHSFVRTNLNDGSINALVEVKLIFKVTSTSRRASVNNQIKKKSNSLEFRVLQVTFKHVVGFNGVLTRSATLQVIRDFLKHSCGRCTHIPRLIASPWRAPKARVPWGMRRPARVCPKRSLGANPLKGREGPLSVPIICEGDLKCGNDLIALENISINNQINKKWLPKRGRETYLGALSPDSARSNISSDSKSSRATLHCKLSSETHSTTVEDILTFWACRCAQDPCSSVWEHDHL